MGNLYRYYEFINEAFLEKDVERAISLILKYLKRKINLDYYPYDEVWHIQKGSKFLRGQLYLSFESPKAFRFNWEKNPLSLELHSIDLWEKFSFERDPDYTMKLNGVSVVKILPKVVDFWTNTKVLVNKKSLLENLSLDNDEERDLEFIFAESEISSTDNQMINQLDQEIQKIDVFKLIELYTSQVARGKSNSLIISGDSGVGKTQTVKDTLSSLGKIKDDDYYFVTGTATTAGLYELLFKNRNKLIVFDDCDAVFKDSESVNILKGALDTYRVREISKMTKGNTFDSMGMSDEEMEVEFQERGKFPNKFSFTGQIIFISNLPEDKFDKAILSRSLHIDVHLSKSELFSHLKNVIRRLSPEVEYDVKLEALTYLTEVCENNPTKFDLNIRSLIHAINLRSNNDDIIQVNGINVPVWKVLIKRYLVKTR